MPNWVFNSLIISGEQSDLDKMVEQLNRPFTHHFPENKGGKSAKQSYRNPVFAFWNITRPDDLNAYYESNKVVPGEKLVTSNGTIDALEGRGAGTKVVFTTDFMEEFMRCLASNMDWYHWNCRNWGTKWDVGVSCGDEHSETTIEIVKGMVTYQFSTAWSPVETVLLILSNQYPNLLMEYDYEEEQGWGGSSTFLGGTKTANTEWDIPMSHKDHTERGKDCICEDWVTDDLECLPYEDCPVRVVKESPPH